MCFDFGVCSVLFSTHVLVTVNLPRNYTYDLHGKEDIFVVSVERNRLNYFFPVSQWFLPHVIVWFEWVSNAHVSFIG